ncbi:hypothetical protein SAMN05518672_101636 [Chitinophaga sp. CF118]|uniref:hypothetical protein n=1 Tax=Chitinophaga sp. CF118 TaxID=1884367 RepID=UPI0008E8162A|nr:hypothetical protein [Chitinophaga sp. CF118]SFD13270.1 hypothetical protein SAMN05518672_101636 [Chitinophaga sp. CF118]
MKNMWISAVILCLFAVLAPVQRSLAQAPMQNIEGNVNAIMSKLNTALTLTDIQKPKISTGITTFLNQRALILPPANSNPKAYDTKLNSMHNGFYRKLKSILTEDQYTSFLQLKPTENDATNVLSQLFY